MSVTRLALVGLVVIGSYSPTRADTSPRIEHATLLLEGGTLFDGSGDEPSTGDVAILDDRIVGVGAIDVASADERIDCHGLMVAPGFIDLHNHSDGPILQEDRRAAVCYLTQGCTTIVTGNCGGGAGDVAEYYAAIDRDGAGVNVAHLYPQGELRDRVMGKAMRKPTAPELAEMRRLTESAMRQGAWGISTGLQYVPSAYAELDELASISEVVARYGGVYASHVRDEGDDLLASIEEAIEIGRRSGVAVHVSHFKASKQRNWGRVRAAAKLIEAARDEGLRVTADQYPYNASSTSIRAMLVPDEEREGGEQAMIERLQSGEHSARLRDIIAGSLEARGPIMIADIRGRPHWIGKLLTEIAAEESRPLLEVAMEVLVIGGASGVSFSMDERDVRFVMALPYVATASDGSSKIDDGTMPHPRSFGTFPRKIGLYAFREGVVSPQQAIRSATGLPADILGLGERGYLREGLMADVVVFDPEALIDTATFESPYGVSEGIVRVVVNGQSVITEGQYRGALAGRALRKVAASDAAE